jgi:hypothetical protein
MHLFDAEGEAFGRLVAPEIVSFDRAIHTTAAKVA